MTFATGEGYCCGARQPSLVATCTPFTAALTDETPFLRTCSGQADVIGPGERNGTCASDIIDGSSLESSAMYYSTGVLSNTNEYLFIGNTFNLLQVVEVETFNFTSVNLTMLSPGAPVTGWGVVASAANHKVIIGTAESAPVAEPTFIYADRVYVPSADGNLYAIQPQYCASQLAVQRARSVLAQSPSDPSVHRPDADLARSLYGTEEAVGAITCAAWIKSFTQPLYAPTRWVPASPAYPANGDGVVLVSETDPQLDTHGVMHALDSITGATLWSMNAEYVDSAGATVTAGLRVVPAVNPTLTPAGTGNQTYVGFMAFGTRVVAFNVYTGAILADINNNAITAASPTGPGKTDIFVSSPTLTADGSTLFVHSSTGTLWKIAVGGAYPAVTLSFVWACDYYIKGKSPLCDNVTLPLLSTAAASDATPLEGAGTWTRRRALAADSGATAAAAEMVNGGFYQPTTRQQRTELYAAIAAEHARLFTAAEDAAAAVKAAQQQVHTAASIAPLLRALPFESVAALSTASGYRLLAPDSVPVGAKLQRIAALAEQAAATRKQGVQPVAAGVDARQLAGLTGSQRRQLRAVLAAATATPASAAADAASRYGFLGVFPFATPSLMPGDAAVIVAQYGFMGGDNGIFSIKPADGSQNWGLQNITSPVDGKVTTFGHSRSSPAIDPSGNVYVGTDSDDGIYTLPLLLAISPAGGYTWLTGIDTDNVVVGSASPIVGQGFKGEKRAYMVSGYGIKAFDEGYACPGALDPFSACSGNGVCNCASGTCTCSNRCFTGPDCGVALTCSGHGTCDGDLGCQCDPCWAGDDCSIPKPCQHGTCTAGVCVCQACWTGTYCEVRCGCGRLVTCGSVDPCADPVLRRLFACGGAELVCAQRPTFVISRNQPILACLRLPRFLHRSSPTRPSRCCLIISLLHCRRPRRATATGTAARSRTSAPATAARAAPSATCPTRATGTGRATPRRAPARARRTTAPPPPARRATCATRGSTRAAISC